MRCRSKCGGDIKYALYLLRDCHKELNILQVRIHHLENERLNALRSGMTVRFYSSPELSEDLWHKVRTVDGTPERKFGSWAVKIKGPHNTMYVDDFEIVGFREMEGINEHQ